MKYIVVEMQKNADGVVSNLVTAHDSLAEAESKFYSILSIRYAHDHSCL